MIEFADINLFNPDVLQRWAQDVTGCVTLIDSLIDTVTDKGQNDQLGLALNVAGPIALAAGNPQHRPGRGPGRAAESAVLIRLSPHGASAAREVADALLDLGEAAVLQ